MPISAACACGKRFRVPDDKAGRTLTCKECGGTFRVPRPDDPRRPRTDRTEAGMPGRVGKKKPQRPLADPGESVELSAEARALEAARSRALQDPGERMAGAVAEKLHREYAFGSAAGAAVPTALVLFVLFRYGAIVSVRLGWFRPESIENSLTWLIVVPVVAAVAGGGAVFGMTWATITRRVKRNAS